MGKLSDAHHSRNWQSLLGPVITEELIKEAHKDALKGLHKMEDKWNTISTVECACGCGTLLSKKTVAKGWTVIRGHKVGIIHNKPLVNKIHAPRPVALSLVNNDAINNFFASQLKLITDQLDEQTKIKDNAIALITQLTTQKDKLVRVQGAIRDL